MPLDPLIASDGVNEYSLSVSTAPGSMTMFNGQMADTSVYTLIVSYGTVVSTENTTAYYLTNPYAPLGFSGETNGVAWTAAVTSFTPFPATLTVGTSGPLLSANYQDSLGNVIGDLTETYTVTGADGPTSVFLSINSAGTLNGAPADSRLIFSVSSAGAIVLAEAKINVNGANLDFRRVPAQR
jgi:hypothetical protein